MGKAKNTYYTDEVIDIINKYAERTECPFSTAVNALILEASKEKDLRTLYTQIRDNMVKLYKRVDLSLKEDDSDAV